MNEFALARVLHIVGVLFWIGGVAFVTTVLLPAIEKMRDAADRVAFFEEIESRFAWQARISTLLTGASGLWLLHRLQVSDHFADPAYWWMHAMVLVWGVFTLMLFVLEPLVLHRWFLASARRDPHGTFRRIRRLHALLLTVSLATIVGAAAGSHGWLIAG